MTIENDYAAAHDRVFAFWTTEAEIPEEAQPAALQQLAEDSFAIGVPLALATRAALHVRGRFPTYSNADIVAAIGRVYAKNQAC